jgi:hypothetical protein
MRRNNCDILEAVRSSGVWGSASPVAVAPLLETNPDTGGATVVYDTAAGSRLAGRARTMLLRHHAAKNGVPDPEYGLTSILDFDGALPTRLEERVAGLEATDLRRAAYVCAELLAAYDQRPFADFVLARLARND